MTYGCGKSDSAILAGKPTNKAVQSAAESVERRVEAKGNTGQQSTYRAQDRESVSGAGPHTASGKAQEEGEVHRALPPYHRPAAAGGVLRTQGECRSWSGRTEMGRIRGGSRTQARRSARTTPAGSVSGAAEPARVHTQVGRAAAPARGCRPRRQNRPKGDCRSAKRDL